MLSTTSGSPQPEIQQLLTQVVALQPAVGEVAEGGPAERVAALLGNDIDAHAADRDVGRHRADLVRQLLGLRVVGVQRRAGVAARQVAHRQPVHLPHAVAGVATVRGPRATFPSGTISRRRAGPVGAYIRSRAPRPDGHSIRGNTMRLLVRTAMVQIAKPVRIERIVRPRTTRSSTGFSTASVEDDRSGSSVVSGRRRSRTPNVAPTIGTGSRMPVKCRLSDAVSNTWRRRPARVKPCRDQAGRRGRGVGGQ